MRDLCEQKEEVWARNGRPNFARQSDFHVIAGFFNMPQSCDMGQMALLPRQRKACCGFFCPKNPTTSAGIEPAILTQGLVGLIIVFTVTVPWDVIPSRYPHFGRNLHQMSLESSVIRE
jgi:hypothetical protein